MTQLPASLSSAIAPWPAAAQSQFHAIRQIILDAANQADIGEIHETLKWGQPSWLPVKSGIGSTLRMGWSDKRPADISLFVNCNTSLGETMRTLYPDAFEHVGNRALHLPIDAQLPSDAIHHCAHLTLTYHRRGK